MHDQPKYEPLEVSNFFGDGRTSRDPVSGTVARGQLRDNDHLYRGIGPDGQLATTMPVPMSSELLGRGRERFDIFCSPCHGRIGNGQGMIVRRGFKQPESFHQNRLREVPVGYFFEIMTNGFGQMSGYASQVPVGDRWAIAAYVRALQLSRNISVAELTPADLKMLEAREGAQPAEPPSEEGHE
ncbi:MAG: c-type cytochrome [Acidobacteriota bacterium]|nr:c-type cytochrome [Acidobacteriota bacterium]